jgi:putative ATP-binding cassette transporter
MMFLAQHPYLAHGSLRDQLLYAMPEGRSVSDDELRDVMRNVGLEAVVDRVGGLDVEQRDWSGVLSPGEHQSLAFARLLLAEPDFAFLDEATSALPAARACALYELLTHTSTTYVSIGSDHALRDYHDTFLQLRGDGTWGITTAFHEPEELTPAACGLAIS